MKTQSLHRSLCLPSALLVGFALLSSRAIRENKAQAQTDPDPDPLESTVETGGDLISTFAPGQRVMIGQTPIVVMEKHSTIEAKKSATGGAPISTPVQSDAELKAQQAYVNKWLGSQLAPTPNASKAIFFRLKKGEIFTPGTAVITPQGEKTLKSLSNQIKQDKASKVMINSNAEAGVAGKRASALKSYLARESGIDASKIQIVSAIHGEEAGKAKFRTSILVVETPGD